MLAQSVYRSDVSGSSLVNWLRFVVASLEVSTNSLTSCT